MSTAYRHCPPPGSPAPAGLRELLGRLEPPDCECPLTLTCPCQQDCPPGVRDSCRHCREECDCPPADYQPPCHHVAAEADPADLCELADWYAVLVPGGQAAAVDDMCAELLRVACPDDYRVPPRALPVREETTREARVDVMVMRETLGLHIQQPRDRWRRRAGRLGIAAVRLANGAVAEGDVRGTGVDLDYVRPEAHWRPDEWVLGKILARLRAEAAADEEVKRA